MRKELSDLVKSKKAAIFDFLQGDTTTYLNHPHRLASVSMSGTRTKVEDTRLFSSAGSAYVAYVTTEYVDGSLLTPWTRMFDGKTPVHSATLSDALPTPGDGEIYLMHRTGRPWYIYQVGVTSPANTLIGTRTTDTYTRSNLSDPFAFSSTYSEDITGSISALTISGGGNTVSGGRDTDPSSKSQIYTTAMGVTSSIYRFPWNDPWDSETDVFSDDLAAWIAAGNTAYGAGYSGSCSLSLDFT